MTDLKTCPAHGAACPDWADIEATPLERELASA